MDAIEKYDPERAVQFKTPRQTRIRGAILDELRVLDWTPRSVRQKAKSSKNMPNWNLNLDVKQKTRSC